MIDLRNPRYRVRVRKLNLRKDRAYRANLLLRFISKRGRHFFRHPVEPTVQFPDPVVTTFVIAENGRVWLIDSFTKKRIYVAHAGRWKGFSNGGTMRRLIEAMYKYIMHDIRVQSHHFGPWPEWLGDGDLWGYGSEAMEEIRREARRLGVIE